MSINRALAVLAATIAAIGIVTAPAQAALTAVGPLDPTNGFPAWYQDANGLQVALCVADPGCPISPAVADFVGPAGEAFYQLASAKLSAPNGGTVTVDFNIEGAFLGAGAGQQITFGRLQVGMTGMEPNATYTVTHPYGSGQWTADAAGDLLRGDRAAARHQAGCAAVPCDFAAALGGELGPFMQWDPAQSMPPAGYIGDGVTPHTIVGPPATSVTVTGPGLPPGGISTNLFVVQGKLAAPPVPVFFAAAGSGAFGTQRVGGSTTRTITVKNNGLAAMPQFAGAAVTGADAGAFSVGPDTCTGTALDSGRTCTIDVAFAPSTTGARSASLTLTDAAGGTHAVPLTGTGATSQLEADPGVLSFFNQPVGTTSSAESVDLVNTGDVPLTIQHVTTDGPNSGEFGIAGNGCRAPVAPHDSCRIAVRFLPSATGARNAALTIVSDAGSAPSNLPLTGTGTGTARTTARPGPSAPRALAIGALRMRKRLTTAQARRGIRLAMDVPAGAPALRLAVYRVTGGRRRLVWSATRSARPGAARLRLAAPALRRALRPGRYALSITPSGSPGTVGTPATVTFLVVRR